MSDNESCDLAAAWVREQIDDQLHDETTLIGEAFEAGDLDQCDCVPVDVTDGRGRRWRLVSVELSVRLASLAATYKCIGCDREHTRADHEADRADMAHSDGGRD